MTTTPTTGQLPGPGYKIDKLISEKLGYKWDGYGWLNPKNGFSAYDSVWCHRSGLTQPQYSTSLDAALELIRKLAEDDIKISIGSTLENTFEVSAWTWDDASLDELELYNVIHENPAYAVCLAFLAVYRG